MHLLQSVANRRLTQLLNLLTRWITKNKPDSRRFGRSVHRRSTTDTRELPDTTQDPNPVQYFCYVSLIYRMLFILSGGRRSRDRMVVGLTTTYSTSAYHHWCCEFGSPSGRDVQHYVIRFQWLATGRWYSPGPPVSSTNKTNRHDITEIMLKVALNTIKHTIY